MSKIMKNAIIFPGQGSQKIGMGKDLAIEYNAAREVFEAVDDALNFKLSEIIWAGDLNELTLTENAQPALMVSSMAILAALKSDGFDLTSADLMAGHSLGEYTALCASGSISLSDTARLLRIRGQAMQACVKNGEGAMAAILGLPAEQIQEILDNFSGEGVCAIANDNDPTQVVISGHSSAVEKVIDLAKESGARRALPLKVSAPFHCQIMQPASKVMEDALSSISIFKPKVPVVMNTRAVAVTDPKEIRSFLVHQITETVRWRETINYMHFKGVSTFYEIGVGKVLSGIVKRIVKEVETVNIASAEDFKFILGGKNHVGTS
jgi:[acyl-carrier-protein] S-malonyltransferase